MRKALRVPAIITDIDGVLIRGGRPILGSADAMKRLKTPLHELNQNKFRESKDLYLPFTCLTNGGAMLEEHKAQSVSEILDLKSASHKIKSSEMIMCSTPFKNLADLYKDQYVLVAGCGDILQLAHSYGFKKAIHAHEYSALFPVLSPLNHKYRPKDTTQKLYQELERRFGDSLNIEKVMKGDQKIPIAACMVFHDIIELEESVQLITDLCISVDGIPGSMLDSNEKQSVKLYISSPDLVYVNDFPLKRYGQGLFKILFEESFKQLYEREPEIITYGKPSTTTFEYCKQVIDKQAELQGLEISQYYMIGDNPAVDIRGARNFNWRSILVETGVYKPVTMKGTLLNNDAQDPADHVVYNFEEAIDLILQEGDIL